MSRSCVVEMRLYKDDSACVCVGACWPPPLDCFSCCELERHATTSPPRSLFSHFSKKTSDKFLNVSRRFTGLDMLAL